MEDETIDLESLRHEYSEACNYHRHYSALRFGMLGVYFAVAGALSSVALGIVGEDVSSVIMLLTRALGFIVTLAFWLFELLCERNMKYFGDFIRNLECKMAYELLTSKGRNRWFKAGNATSTLYLLLSFLWIYALIAGLCDGSGI